MSQGHRSHARLVATRAGLALGLLLSLGAVCARSQELQLGDIPRRPTEKPGHVQLLSEAIEVSAGKPQTVDLRFRVDPGFHINSHKPVDELMIPTSLKLEPNARFTVLDLQFPPGAPFRLGAGVGELLDVYQGEFRVALRLGSMPVGETTVNATLRYQACDNAACFPPRSLPVRLVLKAR